MGSIFPMSEDPERVNRILSLMPGYITLQDSQVRFLCANDRAIAELGFNGFEQMQGLYPSDVRCPAAEIHDQVVANAQYVMARNCLINLLYSVHTARNCWGLFFGQQQPLRDGAEGAIIGVSTHTVEITHTSLTQQVLSLFLEHRGKGRTRIRQGVYKYLDSQQEWNLPVRQGECFFWLLQRKSAKEISHLLDLSRRTVESYIDLIKAKFNVKTLRELLDTAEAEGMSNYIPQHWLR